MIIKRELWAMRAAFQAPNAFERGSVTNLCLLWFLTGRVILKKATKPNKPFSSLPLSSCQLQPNSAHIAGPLGGVLCLLKWIGVFIAFVTVSLAGARALP